MNRIVALALAGLTLGATPANADVLDKVFGGMIKAEASYASCLRDSIKTAGSDAAFEELKKLCIFEHERNMGLEPYVRASVSIETVPHYSSENLFVIFNVSNLSKENIITRVSIGFSEGAEPASSCDSTYDMATYIEPGRSQNLIGRTNIKKTYTATPALPPPVVCELRGVNVKEPMYSEKGMRFYSDEDVLFDAR